MRQGNTATLLAGNGPTVAKMCKKKGTASCTYLGRLYILELYTADVFVVEAQPNCLAHASEQRLLYSFAQSPPTSCCAKCVRATEPTWPPVPSSDISSEHTWNFMSKLTCEKAILKAIPNPLTQNRQT